MDERLTIAKKLGNFLKILHSYPLEQARAMHMDELDPNGYYDFFETIWPENRRTIYPLLTKDEQQWCEQILVSYMETREQSFIPLVTHNDMLPEHIIVDDKKHTLSGVIDFALRIADPARDFMFLHCYGEDFLDTAITEYGDVDTTFKKRRTFYGGNFYVMYLYNAVTTKENDADAIEQHKQALSQYIDEYPLNM